MGVLTQGPVSVLFPDRFVPIIDPDRYRSFVRIIEESRNLLHGRVVWNVNSTARGGGVAEMLRSLLSYARGAEVDARWLVIEGDEDFFRVTKRIHNHLHGAKGDRRKLGAKERKVYEAVLEPNARELTELVRPEDVVILHDPQTAGLIPHVRETGAVCIWRCHIGIDRPNKLARRAWDFLIPYVHQADAYVFSRKSFAWKGLEDEKIAVIPPSIDAFSPKNQDLDPARGAAILRAAGVVEAHPSEALPTFVRQDGTPGRVDRQATLIQDGPVPASARLVAQVSRWDRLKDPVGVIRGFAEGRLADRWDTHLVVAGPEVEAVSDDPEGLEVLGESRKVWSKLPEAVQARVHLACLPMEDREENAAIVNALQRRADVVVQKSIAEGFGLTVAEAMWKGRPVVATRIGGIQDQIIHGITGLLIDDPTDLRAFGEAVASLLEDPEGSARIGSEAQARVRDEFLGARHLMQWAGLIRSLVS